MANNKDTGFSEYVREAEQLESEYAIGRVDGDDAEKIKILAVHITTIAGDAGADSDHLRIKQIMDALHAAYYIGRSGMLRGLGDTPEDFYRICSDALGDDVDLSGFDDYIGSAL